MTFACYGVFEIVCVIIIIIVWLHAITTSYPGRNGMTRCAKPLWGDNRVNRSTFPHQSTSEY